MNDNATPARGDERRTSLDELLDDIILVTVDEGDARHRCGVCGATTGVDGCGRCAVDLARLSSLHALDEEDPSIEATDLASLRSLPSADQEDLSIEVMFPDDAEGATSDSVGPLDRDSAPLSVAPPPVVASVPPPAPARRRDRGAPLAAACALVLLVWAGADSPYQSPARGELVTSNAHRAPVAGAPILPEAPVPPPEVAPAIEEEPPPTPDLVFPDDYDWSAHLRGDGSGVR